MHEIGTIGGERVLVAPSSDDAVLVAVEDPFFGRIATVRLTASDAAAFINALARSVGKVLDPD